MFARTVAASKWAKRQDNSHKVFTRLEVINYFCVETARASSERWTNTQQEKSENKR